MIRKTKNYASETLENVYKIHEGKRLNRDEKKIYLNDDVIIITCSHIKLIEPYLTANKRFYILLDKDVKLSYNDLNLNPNIWFIKTDLKLPNLLFADQTIYHLSYDLSQNSEDNYKSIVSYLKYWIQKYTQMTQELSIDILEPEIDYVNEYSRIEQLTEKTDYVLSDNFESKQLITNTFKKQQKNTYFKMDLSYLDPLNIVKNGMMNCAVISDQSVYELETSFNFELDAYHFFEVLPAITYQEAIKEQFYYFDENPITIKPNKEVNASIKVDLRHMSDDSYINQMTNEYIKKYVSDSKELEVIFSFSILDMRLEDIHTNKKLSAEEIIKKFGEQYTDKPIYQTKDGYAVVTENLEKTLLEEDRFTYIIKK